MPSVSNKQRLVQRLCGSTKRAADPAVKEGSPVLEHLLYAVCREGATRAQADKAFATLRERFFDWNEVRVSAEREVEDALAAAPNSEVRAFRLITILKEIFETTYSFDLELLIKKGAKQAQKHLERLGASPFVVAYTVQRGLDSHSLPLDDDTRRTLVRLEILDREPDEAAMTALEHLVPKAKAAVFCDNLSDIAQSYCHETSPQCTACCVRDMCPTGQSRRVAAHSGAAVKSRARR
jgi:endonuclease-3